MVERVVRLAEKLDEGLRAFTRQCFGGSDSTRSMRVKFALIDVPFGAVKRYLDAEKDIPQQVDDLVLETVAAILGGKA